MGLLYAKVVLLEGKAMLVEKAVLLFSATLWEMSSIV
jgi:hypothetical protein